MSSVDRGMRRVPGSFERTPLLPEKNENSEGVCEFAYCRRDAVVRRDVPVDHDRTVDSVSMRLCAEHYMDVFTETDVVTTPEMYEYARRARYRTPAAMAVMLTLLVVSFFFAHVVWGVLLGATTSAMVFGGDED
ncbi:MAG: hypothetical protein U5J64_10130 [Halobacteriales archaeon]|nr:hypothetical protein [Halobacteriales archaeon]